MDSKSLAEGAEQTAMLADDPVIETRLEVRIGRDEMNLAEFPFTVLSHRVPNGVNTIKFSDTITGKGGKTVRRGWTITGSDAYGLPVAGDEEVYVALMEVTEDYGFEDPRVPITRYDLLRRMGWPRDGHSYKRVQDSLNRLMGVSIVANNSFWDNDAKRYVNEGFHILEGYRLYDEKPGRDNSPPNSYIVWNPVLFNSFRAGNIKQLDTGMYFSLSTPLARRLFRYLDKKRYDGKATYRMKLSKLAFEKLGMSRNYYPSQIKRELRRAHDELIAKGFVREVTYYRPKRRNSEELVIYTFAPKQRPGRIPQDALPEGDNEVLAKLLALGVTEAMARQLVANYADHHIERWTTYCEYKLSQGWLPHESPAAWVVAAIRSKDWIIPEWYEESRQDKYPDIQKDEADLAESHALELEAQREAEQQEYRRIRASIETELGIGESTKAIWEQTRAILKERGEMSPALLSTYLLPIRGKTAVLVTPVPFFGQYIQRILPLIGDIVREVSGKGELNVEVACQENLAPPYQSRLDWSEEEDQEEA
jgi:plasmid replication initiation protein